MMVEDRWVGPKNTKPREETERRSTTTFGLYFLGWAQRVAGEQTVPKIGVTAMAATLSRVESALGTALLFVLIAWAADFVVGVARAVADPDMRLRADRAQNGIMRLLVIPTIAIVAAIIEGMTLEVVGWDPSGKLILAVCVAMFWEECISIQRNSRYFYRSLRLRFSTIPWFDDDEDEDED